MVRIAGPQEVIENIEKINTASDTLLRVRKDIAQEISIELLQQQIQLSQQTVSLTVDIQPLSERIIK